MGTARAKKNGVDAERLTPLRTLAGGLADAVNTPLTSVLANVEHVLRRLRAMGAGEADGEDVALELPPLVDALSRALEAGDRMRELTHDLMVFARTGAERRELVDVRSVVEAAIHIAAPEIRSRARIVRALSEVPPVEADEARLAQTFVSILENAAEAIPEGGVDVNEVRIATGTDAEGRALIEVTDTGNGMAKETIEHLFDPFFTTRPARGLGLGLSFAHGAVTSLGGEMTIESEIGEGCVVRVALPGARSQRAEPQRVLVVADQPDAGEALALALGGALDATVAEDAKDALARLAAAAYDAVVCDATPPGMCSVELFAEAVRRQPSLAERFVFLTGGKITDRTRRLLEGMRPRCLEKPPDIARLRELIRHGGARAR